MNLKGFIIQYEIKDSLNIAFNKFNQILNKTIVIFELINNNFRLYINLIL